ncbi:hypothetical protein PH235_07770 [Trichococcus sp. K1Tr]|uniref:hypothetical protein n=1 Tax=Trichococcus sp. K1Tr TaxID=3020847 RepID=UPI00232F3192|nr:hypothetical protein [Trichococcus sp. K1Tr]MDB6353457.1 hypothetical protein [Trichococcus sp. K1Tr]
MATQHDKKVKFNSKMTVSNTDGNLFSDSGPILVKNFADSPNYYDLDLSEQCVDIVFYEPNKKTVLIIARYFQKTAINILTGQQFFL